MMIQCYDGSDAQGLEAFLTLDRRLYPERNRPVPPPPGSAVLFCVTGGDLVKAHAAALVNPSLPGGLLGWFEAENSPDAAAALFDAVQAHFSRLGISSVIGPMNGSTWESYRVALPEGTPFFLDAESMPYYWNLFESNGFEVIAEYHSSRADLSETSFRKLEQLTSFFQSRGVTIENFERGKAEVILREIHELSLESFRNNFLYSPISLEYFLQKYLPLVVNIPPEFILLARDPSGRLAGFLFSVPNLLCRDRKELILKTIAVRPDCRRLGLGTFLVELCRRRAFEAGFQTVYHALIYDANPSARIERSDMTVCRRYRLYRRTCS